MYYLIYILPLYLSAVTVFGLFLYALRYCHVRASLPFAFSMLICLFWTVFTALNIPVTDLNTSILLTKIYYTTLAFAGVAGFAVALSITGYGYLLNHRIMMLLCLIPVGTVILNWTSDYHKLFRYDFYYEPIGDRQVFRWEKGVWYWVHNFHVYALLAAALLLLAFSALYSRSIYRRQSLIVFISILIPAGADVLSTLQYTPWPGYNFAPALFFITGLGVAWAIYRYRMFDLIPIGRNRIVDHLSDLVLVLDAHDRLVDFNPPAQKALNLKASESIGEPIATVFKEWPGKYDETQNDPLEIKLNSERGASRFYTFRLEPIVSGKNKVVGKTALLHDITDRVLSEKVLRESEERYRFLAENITDVVVKSTIRGVSLYISPSCRMVLGYEPEELIDHSIFELVHPDDREALHQAGAGVLHRKTEFFTYRIRHKEGHYLWVETHSRVIFEEGVPQYILAVVRDVTERVKTQEQLRESEERYRLLAENTSDVIFRNTPAGTISYVSPASTNLLGYSPEQLLGRSLFELIPVEEFDQIRKTFKKNLDQSATPVVSHIFPHKNGYPIWVETSVKSVTEPETGAILSFVGVTRDITERKRTEEALIEERLKASSLEALGLLAGGLAHDFNNILTVIVSNLYLAREDLSSVTDATEALKDAEKAAMRARDLTGQLLTFARGGAPVKVPARLKDIVQETTQFILLGSAIEAEFDFPDTLWPVEIDLVQFSRVIQNLVQNAIQAMPWGGKIRLKAINNTLVAGSVPPLQAGNYVKITVEDEGTGISAEDLTKIFNPYFTTRPNSTGMGLAICYSIIRKHDGQILVESEFGKGTTVSLYLPFSGRDLPQPVPDENLVIKETARQPQTRILFMDDEPMIRDAMNRLLEKKGHFVVTAADGVEAIEHYRQAKQRGVPFDVVVMDLTIPGGMGGKEAVKKLLEFDPYAKVIVASGYSDSQVIANYQNYGFIGRLNKPFTIVAFEQALYQAMAQTDTDYF